MRLHSTLLQLAAGRLKGPIGVVAGLGLGVFGCWVAQSLLVAHLIVAALRGASWTDLGWPVLALVSVVLLRSGLLWTREAAAQWAGVAIKSRLREQLFRTLLELGPARLTQHRTGAVKSILVDGVEGLQGYFAHYLPQAVTATLGSLGLLAYLATVDPVVAAVLAIFVVLVPVAPLWWRRAFDRRGQQHWSTYEEVEADYVDAMQGMTTLKLLSATGQLRQQFRRRTHRLYVMTMRQLATSLIGSNLTTLLVGVGSATAVAVGVLRAGGGHLGVAELLIVLLLAAECFRPFTELAGYWHMSYVGFSAADSIKQLLGTSPPARTGNRVPTHPSSAAEVTSHEITFSGVRFTYPERDRPALNNFDLQVRPGEMIALVGPSGAGKTTVFNLLLRFVEPQDGTVTLRGRNLTDIPVEQLRNLVALVPQDPYLFHGTIEDNVALGRADADPEVIHRAVALAGADRFIRALPDGYRTHLAERGLTLSGGQRQRLAIARALVRDSPILLLDEPTSNVEGQADAVIQAALASLKGRKTILVIAHRLSTVQTADRIVVVHHGRVTESGHHDDLVQRRGDYYRMLRLQEGAA
ncbi:HlyB/MsbA family ABC transporter [Longimycelium tulufanense]|uniref:HlyB/MsbA family ABC transporter n=1 Tax=Longimycelium tulufanense TaxID=907463 RepID=A0A8J3CKS7_9PSEU|nr:ABC transporter ATP-binding protein [Longimycelium tulufanense]GGM78799.1 HlyB/MsbA family ABC transporter [Longimycelium tulufanense]